jgi:membrane protein
LWASLSGWRRTRENDTSVSLAGKLKPTLKYWMETEVHVYGFSVAANVLLSFFPFLIVLVSLCRYVFHWPAAENAIYFALDDTFPGEVGNFLARNLQVTVNSRGPFQVVSVLLLLFTANGVFEPLEVALNRAFGSKENRSFFKNQLVSLGLIFACGTLAVASTTLTALNRDYLKSMAGTDGVAAAAIVTVFFKMVAIPMTMIMLLLVYWLLPNCRVRIERVLPAAVVVGLLLEALKYGMTALWPWLRLKLNREYGPFKYSVAIIFLSFFAAMIVLAGAEWAARAPEEVEDPTPLRERR